MVVNRNDHLAKRVYDPRKDNVMLNARLEDTWEKADPLQQATATTEARVLLENLVHYTSRGQLENDVLMAAATLLWFRNLTLATMDASVANREPGYQEALHKSESNIMSEEQVAKLARKLNDIVQKFHLGITEPNEMLGDLVIKLQEAGVKI